jgi:hypothetical protein
LRDPIRYHPISCGNQPQRIINVGNQSSGIRITRGLSIWA